VRVIRAEGREGDDGMSEDGGVASLVSVKLRRNVIREAKSEEGSFDLDIC
jgi:hypothetical protein